MSDKKIIIIAALVLFPVNYLLFGEIAIAFGYIGGLIVGRYFLNR